MGSIAGKSPSGNTTQTAQNVPFNANFLTNLGNNAQNLQQIPAYPGQQVAQLTPGQQQGIDTATNLGFNDPTMRGASAGIQPYLSGQMLSAGNPYFGNMINQIGQAIQPSIDSHFNMNGRAGSGANNQAFASALANTAGGLAYQNFNDQSTNQLKAFLEAPAVSSGNFADIQQAMGAQGQLQGQNQANINALMNTYYQNKLAPFNLLSQQSALFGQPIPGQQSTISPYFTNSVGGGIGALNTLFGGSGLTGQGPSLASNLGSGISKAGSGLSSLFSNLFGSGGGGVDPSFAGYGASPY